MYKKEKQGMPVEGSGNKLPKSDLGMNMNKKDKFVNFNLKDNAQAGEVKMINPDCANMG